VSNPQKRIRQPGGRKKYLKDGHFPCGVCASGCMPESITVSIFGFDQGDPSLGAWYSGTCSQIASHAYTLDFCGSLADYCQRSKDYLPGDDQCYCAYCKDISTANDNFRIWLILSCDTTSSPSRLRANCYIDQMTGDYPTEYAYTADNDTAPCIDLPDGCGTANCDTAHLYGLGADFKITSGLTIYQCNQNPNGTPAASWSIYSVGNCKSCDSLGTPCCCGGRTRKCYYVCFYGTGCPFDNRTIPACFSPGDAKATGKINLDDGSTLSVRFDPKISPPTLEWSCDDWANSKSHTFDSGDSSTTSGNRIWTADSVPKDSDCCPDGADTMTIQLSYGIPVCHGTAHCVGFKTGTTPDIVFIELAPGWVAQTCPNCAGASGIFGLDGAGAFAACSTNNITCGYVPDPTTQFKACTWGYCDLEFASGDDCAAYGSTCGPYWYLGINASTITSPSDPTHFFWTASIKILMPGSAEALCHTCYDINAYYIGPIMPRGDNVDLLANPVTLTLASTTNPDDYASPGFLACTGDPPSSITLFKAT
jgi:hypothetical protein